MLRYNGGGAHLTPMKLTVQLKEITIKQVTRQISTWLKNIIHDLSNRHILLIKYSTIKVGDSYQNYEEEGGRQCPSKKERFK